MGVNYWALPVTLAGFGIRGTEGGEFLSIRGVVWAEVMKGFLLLTCHRVSFSNLYLSLFSTFFLILSIPPVSMTRHLSLIADY